MPLTSPGTTVRVDGAVTPILDIDSDLLDLAEGELLVGGESGLTKIPSDDDGTWLQNLGDHAPGWGAAPGGGSDALLAIYDPRRWSSARATSATGASGNKYWLAADAADTISVGANSATAPKVTILPIVGSELAVTGFTPMLRVRAYASCGTTVGTLTVSVGLYPVTNGANLTLGTVVSGSEAAITDPGANALSTLTSGSDFAVPSDGYYSLGYTLSEAPDQNLCLFASVSLHWV